MRGLVPAHSTYKWGILMSETHTDRTLDAIDDAIMHKERKSKPRGYFGMSGKHECDRQDWYSFRFAKRIGFDAKTLKRFADGHAVEDLMAKRLKTVPGLTLIVADPETGRQLGHKAIHNHLRGHQDGHIRGLVDDPLRWYVWEHKSVNENSFRKLGRLIDKHGEENALKEWNQVYWNQAQLYMHFSETPRHYMTITTPGGRDHMKCVTPEVDGAALELVERIEEIIFATEKPIPISHAPHKFFGCKFCSYKEMCDGTELPARNCRTCIYSEPMTDGDALWKCNHHEERRDAAQQLEGCKDHRYLPAMTPYDVEFMDQENNVHYRTDVGKWTDGGA